MTCLLDRLWAIEPAKVSCCIVAYRKGRSVRFLAASEGNERVAELG